MMGLYRVLGTPRADKSAESKPKKPEVVNPMLAGVINPMPGRPKSPFIPSADPRIRSVGEMEGEEKEKGEEEDKDKEEGAGAGGIIRGTAGLADRMSRQRSTMPLIW